MDNQSTWKVGVVGLGAMGSGITQVVASHGYAVTAVDTSDERCQQGIDRIERFMQRGIELGKTRPEDRDRVLNGIRVSTSLGDLALNDVIIEAVYENLGVKQEVFRGLLPYVSANTILATNTSGLSVHAIAQGLPLTMPLIGLHFFNPPQLMRLVEVVSPLEVSSDVIGQVKAFCNAIGKEPVVVKDRPGFLVNRLLIPYLNQAIDAFDHQLASREDLDNAVELGLGYPMGPLKLLDQIGLDVHLHATTALYQQTYLPEFRPPIILEELVDAGRLGHKTGRGFYSYGKGKQSVAHDDGSDE